jgi:hypothetical protein
MAEPEPSAADEPVPPDANAAALASMPYVYPSTHASL